MKTINKIIPLIQLQRQRSIKSSGTERNDLFHFDPTSDKILLQEITPCATDSGNLQNKSSDENFYVHVN